MSAESKTIRVTLAEAPTDVLVWLVDNPMQHTTSIVAAVAPADADEPEASVRRSLSLLVELSYVTLTYDDSGDTCWYATVAGCKAVSAARSSVVSRTTQ